jgi:hypothetical protein
MILPTTVRSRSIWSALAAWGNGSRAATSGRSSPCAEQLEEGVEVHVEVRVPLGPNPDEQSIECGHRLVERGVV